MAFNNYKSDKYIFPKLRTREGRLDILRAIRDKDGSSLPLSVMETDNSQHDLILKEFLEAFPDLDSIKTFDQFLRMSNISKEVRSWYVDIKAEIAVELSCPEWLKKFNGGRDAWKKSEKERISLSEKEKTWSSRETKASEAFKKELDSIRTERTSTYKTLNKLTIINRITVNELPRERALRVALASTPDLRAQISSKEVAAFKTDLFRDFLAGKEWTDPFA